jgi:hypothetical protein
MEGIFTPSMEGIFTVLKKDDGSTRRSNVSKPRMVVYDIALDGVSDRRAAVIVVPGGGFTKLADDHEGAEACRWLNSRGFVSFLVLHRTPTAEMPEPSAGPVQDVQKAVLEVRKRAAEADARAVAAEERAAMERQEHLRSIQEIAQHAAEERRAAAASLGESLGPRAASPFSPQGAEPLFTSQVKLT